MVATCDGVLVVAYERKFVTTGFEKPNGERERKIINEKYTTPWNHVESAIAFSMNLPLYIICERGLTEEGLIETKADWYVHYMDFTLADLSNAQLVEALRSWVNDRVIRQSRKPKALLSAVAKLRLSEMTGEEWIAILSMLAAAFGLGVAVQKLIPNLFH